jgi:hypothetical protein
VHTRFCWGNLKEIALGINKVEVRCTKDFVGETGRKETTWNKQGRVELHTVFCWGNLRKRALGIYRIEVRCTQDFVGET